MSGMTDAIQTSSYGVPGVAGLSASLRVTQGPVLANKRSQGRRVQGHFPSHASSPQ